jgi:hypothetical protein
MNKKTLYGVSEIQYLIHLKIAEIKEKIRLLKKNYNTYSSRNTELDEAELLVAKEIYESIESKKVSLKKWENILKENYENHK